MYNEVWVSNAPVSEQLLHYGFESDVSEEAYGKHPETRNGKGEILPRSVFPTMIYKGKDSGNFGSLPHLFYADGFWLISDEAANVLNQFDLGGGSLYPITVTDRDQTTPLFDGTYFMVNFGNAKDAFVPEQSRTTNSFGIWHASPLLKPDDIVVSVSALEGPDIWIDKSLTHSFFVSGRLSRALKSAGMLKAFRLLRCRLV